VERLAVFQSDPADQKGPKERRWQLVERVLVRLDEHEGRGYELGSSLEILSCLGELAK